jgi:hypothetical protein
VKLVKIHLISGDTRAPICTGDGCKTCELIQKAKDSWVPPPSPFARSEGLEPPAS